MRHTRDELAAIKAAGGRRDGESLRCSVNFPFPDDDIGQLERGHCLDIGFSVLGRFRPPFVVGQHFFARAINERMNELLARAVELADEELDRRKALAVEEAKAVLAMFDEGGAQ
ncbi:MAG: hypothetical protein GWO40_13010 [Gammaproteobacteria bacterium]|nr:hypothetical protein [Gammaproteobacteria bacterium]NIX86460.1 hypothetical protein [Gammaproteobacteria bacterium]